MISYSGSKGAIGLNESELYKELGILTKDKDRWKDSIPYVASLLTHDSVKIQAKVRLSFVWASENIATNTPDIYADHIPVFEELLHDADDKVRMEAPEIFRVLGKRRPEFVNGSMSALDYSSREIVAADLIIKAVGIILAIFVYPPITLFAVILAGCVVTFLPHIVNRKNKKRGEIDAV